MARPADPSDDFEDDGASFRVRRSATLKLTYGVREALHRRPGVTIQGAVRTPWRERKWYGSRVLYWYLITLKLGFFAVLGLIGVFVVIAIFEAATGR